MKKTDRHKPGEKTMAVVPVTFGSSERKSRGRRRDDASFSVPPTHQGLPTGYGDLLSKIKRRIGTERLRTVMAANSAMVMLYWDIEASSSNGRAAKVGAQGSLTVFRRIFVRPSPICGACLPAT